MLSRLRKLLGAVYRSVCRAMGQGVSVGSIFHASARALRKGPRHFLRSILAYADGFNLHTESRTSPDSYADWLRAQPEIPVRVDAGLISVVMPVCNTPERFLREAIASVEAQTYRNWEICIHDDASDQPHVLQVLEELRARMPGMRVSRSVSRQGIAAATNAAIALARGHWITFLDHDDVLEPDALAAVVDCHQRTLAEVVYTDHDVLGEDGRLRDPYFKPDWNLDLFLSQMYLGHLVSFDAALIRRVGDLRSDCDGSQDYDLVLRCIAAGAHVAHVPKVLYHWRAHAGSTAANAHSKPYAHDAGRLALQEHVQLRHPGAHADDGAHLFCYDVRYPYADNGPLASIVIPTRDGLDLLRACVESLYAKTDYRDFEIIVVDNGSEQPETLQWLQGMSRRDGFRVIRADVPFNWSALNNLAAREARGEVFVFLNNDTEVIDGQWLQRLAENALRPDVGVCGPLLLYGDRTIQHAGVVIGMGGWADHVFKGEAPVHHQNLFVSPVLQRQVLAVTGACMAVSRDTFDALGGFDESFIVCGSDVEFCLRAHARGLAIVYVARAVMIHHESKTRDPRAIPESDFVRSAQAYSPYREDGDPFFSPNLDYMASSPRLRGASQ
ncbi:glycosyltransferase family 2 protein [Thermomonas sp. HDW16]|uniref:glycosyltransferase family 2 protein n=1 Tax=Thermomonas sp. HDW16 TaxID=2714945 RepID=UPI001F0E4FEC|nr:glycosyltransferase family 2 protein [Thermomonas sp. HDW16]